jgi:hypothetical protein
MPQPIATRRAAAYRIRAQQLGQIAAREWREDVRRHLLDQAATYQRAADAMAPKPASPAKSAALHTEPPRSVSAARA